MTFAKKRSIGHQNPILPIYAGKMGILRVKRDSPYLSNNNDVNNMCLADTQQTVALMRKMWVLQTAER